ncbi:hypothetical protein HanXRQr2_Chr04g0146531 [Helianthus annuus]|uniref:Uncharacterized protein n=1 Tax=Helianthus annuus TaxID=4232 RepID=A0A9K3NPR2_HELAN|nr:hypothetical protein HanXRQr2_Chr04g0146531 [Helianthus annuus]KAJ0929759.1 hypothetical protein HanPSC8_Chr04g0141321 [Helianthus annuus]
MRWVHQQWWLWVEDDDVGWWPDWNDPVDEDAASAAATTLYAIPTVIISEILKEMDW